MTTSRAALRTRFRAVIGPGIVALVLTAGGRVAAAQELTITPHTAELLVGETVTCALTGTYLAPVAWYVSDPEVAEISSGGVLRALAEGECQVLAIDSADEHALSGIYRVSSLEFKLPTLSVTNRAGTFAVELTSDRLLNGSDIHSLELELLFDPDVVVGMGATSSGTLTTAWGTPAWHVADNRLIVAHAGATPLSGSGPLLRLLLRPAPGAGDDDRSPLSLARIVLNEGHPTARVTAGSVTVRGARVVVESVSVSPSTAVVHARARLRLTADVVSNGGGEVAWSLLEGSAYGSVDDDGNFEAPLVPPSPPIATVVATSLDDPDAFDSARITILAAGDAPALTLSLLPNPARPRSFQIFVLCSDAPAAAPVVQIDGVAVPVTLATGSSTIYLTHAHVGRLTEQVTVQATATVDGQPASASATLAF